MQSDLHCITCSKCSPHKVPTIDRRVFLLDKYGDTNQCICLIKIKSNDIFFHCSSVSHIRKQMSWRKIDSVTKAHPLLCCDPRTNISRDSAEEFVSSVLQLSHWLSCVRQVSFTKNALLPVIPLDGVRVCLAQLLLRELLTCLYGERHPRIESNAAPCLAPPYEKPGILFRSDLAPGSQ